MSALTSRLNAKPVTRWLGDVASCTYDDSTHEIGQIEAYIEMNSGSSEVAAKFAERLIAKCEHLAELPTMIDQPRPELLPDLRCFPFGNYLIFFRYVGDKFQVVNRLHGARDIGVFYELDTPED